MNVVKTQTKRTAGFTLIELLAVIAIIGLLASFVIGLSGVASGKSKQARVRAELQKLVTLVETYKLELGFYPPDNQNKLSDLREHAARNPLFYELSGAVFQNNKFRTLNQTEEVDPADLKREFGVSGINNSAREERGVPYRAATFKPSQYKELAVAGDVELLAVPVKGPHELDGKLGKINPWYYDASSTNRHNDGGVDIWAEIIIGRKTNILSNWQQ